MFAFIAKRKLKLLLSVFAMCIALASLLYTSNLVRHLKERERTSVTIWAAAIEQVALAATQNPYEADFRVIADKLDPNDPMTQQHRAALAWASRLPPGDHNDFIFDIISDPPDVPAAIVDEVGNPITWQHLGIPEDSELTPEDSLEVMQRIARMDRNFDPIMMDLAPGLIQRVHYGESSIIRDLRIYPYLQLTFVALFIAFGYLGFSYARRSEQSNLWVGMAREAAHQLGTPISSLMGWIEVMRMNPEADHDTLKEVDADVQRLGLVANRFNDIGSVPKLEVQALAPVVDATANYIRRRFPRRGMALTVDVPEELQAPINAELFAWVVENLLKNAMDAIENEKGRIQINSGKEKDRVYIDVSDNGKGIDRGDWSTIFKPGYSTKTRGWGLGLSLAKRIVVDYHGGMLTLTHSVVGQGSTFRILLPQS
ncbi:MAG: HAMP domain-containing histidine kinase [Rhodothermaceae bacterium]|nr:HAMP domain-containing histidine kinase [Rhodothermaceae bacterium]MXX96275.1 HAMP domain-containing histidine kinase [Rhodothermaceae bacterium]MXZ18952.1 HAMP domain-containing histidine kinase [Rhodothermaceae bacterium]MXZ57059.1 HAMP domain-containing histidine kinase [Rhodothermaceae bacterium]MYB90791.1 HAMP domain-containing histidine kinase [Rhodothermaceae bacterium]